MWPRSKRPRHEQPTDEQVEQALEQSDVHEARRMRSEASWELRLLRDQKPGVAALADMLGERRKQNHFGRDIEVTYTRRHA